ncbi:hypothetical protein C0J52_22555 [Blattella germanica]|nr:hypothetical protein C0J52_22555 [Blattella germanica]
MNTTGVLPFFENWTSPKKVKNNVCTISLKLQSMSWLNYDASADDRPVCVMQNESSSPRWGQLATSLLTTQYSGRSRRRSESSGRSRHLVGACIFRDRPLRLRLLMVLLIADAQRCQRGKDYPLHCSRIARTRIASANRQISSRVVQLLTRIHQFDRRRISVDIYDCPQRAPGLDSSEEHPLFFPVNPKMHVSGLRHIVEQNEVGTATVFDAVTRLAWIVMATRGQRDGVSMATACPEKGKKLRIELGLSKRQPDLRSVLSFAAAESGHQMSRGTAARLHAGPLHA